MSEPPPEHNHNHRHTGGAAVGTKRQRRPSVRLGDLGGGNLISTYYFDHILPRQPKKARKEAVIDKENGVDSNGNSVGKSKKGLKKRSGGEEVNVGDLDGGGVGSWKGRGSASRGGGGGKRENVGSWKGRVSESRGGGKGENVGDEGDLDGVAVRSWKGRVSGSRGGRSSVGAKLVDGSGSGSGNEDDLDGVAIGRALGRRGGRIGSNGRRGDRSNVGFKLVGENRNERGEDDGDRNFEPICSEEEEDGEANRDDSSPIRLFDKDNSDGGDGEGNENFSGGRGYSDGVEKGRNGKDLRFQVSDEMDDPSDLSERSGVKVWLQKLGLQRYALNFEIHEVDDEVLPLLTLEDLKDMGITAVGSRRKMFCSIRNLNK